jgi:hypothetical protein
MPNCFTLTPIGKTEPALLTSVDEAICNHFGAPVDPVKYYFGWFDCIGFRLATGSSFDKMEAEFSAEDEDYYRRMLEIVKFLKANYTSDAFAQIGGRR